MLNPVYSSLNNITGSNSFPQIDNVNTQLLPNNFYDARIRINQPIYYPDLAINKKLKEGNIQLKALEIKAFKRIISKEVMISYFQYIMSKKVIDIYDATDTLLTEAKRSTQSLIRNGVALPTALARIETQIATVNAIKMESEANYSNAKRYFAFVNGQDADKVVIPEIVLPILPELIEIDKIKREEIEQIDQGITLQRIALENENQFYLPKLGAQIDLGSQAFDFGFKPYALMGINLELNLFDNKRHNLKSESIKAEIIASEFQKVQVEKQIILQTDIARENLYTAVSQAKTYKSRIISTEKIYHEVFKKYKEGTSNYLELIDAQTLLTQINTQFLIAQNNAWLKWAEYVYATATFPIK
ncbi:MAG: TolC family protein [Saprospiraceae bacterium]|nr:TolC family protein [Saprospiraceae bacterium]